MGGTKKKINPTQLCSYVIFSASSKKMSCADEASPGEMKRNVLNTETQLTAEELLSTTTV